MISPEALLTSFKHSPQFWHAKINRRNEGLQLQKLSLRSLYVKLLGNMTYTSTDVLASQFYNYRKWSGWFESMKRTVGPNEDLNWEETVPLPSPYESNKMKVKNDHLSKFIAMIILHFHLQPQYKYGLFSNILHIKATKCWRWSGTNVCAHQVCRILLLGRCCLLAQSTAIRRWWFQNTSRWMSCSKRLEMG